MIKSLLTLLKRKSCRAQQTYAISQAGLFTGSEVEGERKRERERGRERKRVGGGCIGREEGGGHLLCKYINQEDYHQHQISECVCVCVCGRGRDRERVRERERERE